MWKRNLIQLHAWNETWSYPHNVSSGKAPGSENRKKMFWKFAAKVELASKLQVSKYKTSDNT